MKKTRFSFLLKQLVSCEDETFSRWNGLLEAVRKKKRRTGLVVGGIQRLPCGS